MPQKKNTEYKSYIILALILILLIVVPILSYTIIKNSQKYKTGSRATNIESPTIYGLNDEIREYLIKPDIQSSLGPLEDLLNTRKNLLASALNDPDNLTDQTLDFLLLSEEEVARIPDELKSRVEEYIPNLNGKTEVTITDNFEEGKSSIKYGLTTKDGQHLDILIPGQSTEPLLPGNTDVSFPEKVPVFENMILLLSGYREGTQFGTPPDIQRNGDVRYAVILVNFEDDKSEPKTRKEIYDIIFNRNNPTSVASYYNEVSYGQFNIVGSEDDILGWYTIPKLSDKCDLFKWSEAAEAKSIIADPVKLLGFGTNRIYFFPMSRECKKEKTNGQAVLNDNRAMVNIDWPNPIRTSQVTAHEIGHTLGIFHAFYYTDKNLADRFDVMNEYASNYVHFNSYFKSFIGWIPITEAQYTKHDPYYLAPIEVKSTLSQVIRIPRRDNPLKYYYLEYRRPIGLDKNTYLNEYKDKTGISGGIQIREDNLQNTSKKENETESFKTNLIDVTPETNDKNDAFLSDGRYFYDPTNKIRVTQISHDENQAVVNIQFDAPNPASSPSITPFSIYPIPTPTITTPTATQVKIVISGNPSSFSSSTTVGLALCDSEGKGCKPSLAIMDFSAGVDLSSQVIFLSKPTPADSTATLRAYLKQNDSLASKMWSNYSLVCDSMVFTINTELDRTHQGKVECGRTN